jgi:hypothetical protein
LKTDEVVLTQKIVTKLMDWILDWDPVVKKAPDPYPQRWLPVLISSVQDAQKLKENPGPPFHFDANPDPTFHFEADPVLHITIHFDADSDPAPHKSDANLRPSTAPFGGSTAPPL